MSPGSNPPAAAVLFVFDRYRWVGDHTVKCGLRSATRARNVLGGRVDCATATLLADGTYILSPWSELLPAQLASPPTGPPADPQDPPTREHEHG